MDPDLKARLRWLKPGSREYQATIEAYNREKAAVRTQEMQLRLQAEGAAAEREQRGRNAEAARQGAQRQEEEGRQARERAAQQERENQTGMVTAASTAAGLSGGVLAGWGAGKYANPRYKAEMNARGAEIRTLGETARAINPQAPGARGAYQDVTASAQRGNLLRRPIPWGTGSMAAGVLAPLGLYSSFERAPNARSDTERAIWTGTGYGELGAAGEMVAGSIHRYRNPGVSYPAADVAAIEGAGRMARGGELAPLTPPAGTEASPREPVAASSGANDAALRAARRDTLMSLTVEQKRELARRIGVPVSGNKAELADRILDRQDAAARGEPIQPPRRAGRMPRVGGAVIPLAMGGLAYDAASSEAEAAGLDPSEARNRGLVAGGVAGGTTATVPYAINKLSRYAPVAAAGKMLPVAGSAMGPLMAADAYDPSPEQLAMDRNTAARNLPSALRGGAVEDAYQMAQVPERGERPRGYQDPETAMIPGTDIATRAARSGAYQAAMQQLLDSLQEHNDSISPPPGRNPAISYEAAQ